MGSTLYATTPAPAATPVAVIVDSTVQTLDVIHVPEALALLTRFLAEADPDTHAAKQALEDLAKLAWRENATELRLPADCEVSFDSNMLDLLSGHVQALQGESASVTFNGAPLLRFE